MEKLIYIAEDEENIRELIKCTLDSYGYKTVVFDNGESLLDAITTEVPDLFLLDIMMPQIDGITALKQLRKMPKTKDIPVIMITAKSGEYDKVRGLDAGADDYITKPFGLLELSARVRSALRRGEKSGTQKNTESLIKVSDLQIDTKTREIIKNGEQIDLTYKEFELLMMLIQNSNRIVPREELLDKIWGYDYIGETRTLDMHIRTLRNKIGDNAENPIYIKTARGIGYRFI
ncbi:MAG: response regulator transcription factor [Oscillospiraceae bacterium]